ncbi:MAG: SusC/RagA family TonB-linked outer membrane protein [Bacteroidetes bacterium]|nr:SusC/RagA family TonB-linked outer membrane protein [Bacteroidota bacterium]
MSKIFTVSLFLLSLVFPAVAQVTGTITDQKDKLPVAGASIVIKGTGNGTTSDVNGKFSLPAKAGDVLEISFVGYTTQQVTLGTQTDLNITLEEDVRGLNEVVVTALGVSRSTKSLGYVTQTVTGQQLTSSQDANLINNLQGKMAGVTITNGGAGVGSTSRIVIRGVNTFNGSGQPLFVVDGVPINNETIFNNAINNNSTAGTWAEVDWGNGAAEFNAADASEITVLKSAAATALYGTRAAGGAIIITTKKADGDKGKWHAEFSSQNSINTPLILPKIQNQYGEGTGSAAFKYVNGAGSTENNIPNYGLAFSPSTLVEQFDSPVLDASGNVIPGLQAGDLVARAAYPGNTVKATPWVGHSDNFKNFLQTGSTSINNISLSTVTDQGSYRISFGNLTNKGIVPGTDLTRYQLSVRAETKLSEKLKANYYIGYINSSSNNRPNIGYGSESVMYTFFGVYGMPEDINLNSLKNKWWQTGQEGYQQFRYWANHDNPYVTGNLNTNSFKKNRLLGNASLKYDITPELNVMVRTGLDFYNDHREGHRVFSTVRFPTGGFRTDDVTYLENNTDFLINYTRKSSPTWNYNVSLGGNRFQQTSYYLSNVANALIVPGLYNFSNASVLLNPFEQKLEKIIYSGYAFGEVSYQNWLYLNLTARNDVSSTLPKGKNSFLYPSASLSAVVSDKLTLPAAVSFLKLRASIAQVGRDANPYSINNTFIPNTPFGSYPLTSGNATLSNSNLKPSTTTMDEFGFDVRFLHNRLGLDFAVFNSDTKDEVVQLPVPASSGYNGSYTNGGSINVKGLELILSYSPIKSNTGLNWDMNFNFTHYVSTVTALPQGVNSYEYFLVTQYNRAPRQINYFANVGQKLGNIYGNQFIRDDKGNIVYNNGLPTFTQTNDKLLGNYNPDFILTWNNTLSYKNFKFNMLWDWHHGGVIYSYTRLALLQNGMSPETLPRPTGGIIGKGVKSDGTPNDVSVSAASYYLNYYSPINHEPFVSDASYLKLRQLSFGYTFRNILKNNPSASVELSFIGRNLLLFAPIHDIDPETLALRGNTILPGVEYNSLPSQRQFGVSLNLKY